MAKWTRDTRCTDCASSPHARLGQSLTDAISGKADSRQAEVTQHSLFESEPASLMYCDTNNFILVEI
jgi:hypothetical protein